MNHCIHTIKEEFSKNGFAVIENIYTPQEANNLLHVIEQATGTSANFRKTETLFAIRRFLQEVPDAVAIIFNNEMRKLIARIFDATYFAVKAIYFDKPKQPNWFVAWHQDITIAVTEKKDVPGFGPWTVKPGQFTVQPPLALLQNNFTIRIHLDDTTEQNGALKIIPGSHLHGIYAAGETTPASGTAIVCAVARGGIMLMHPLLLHASGRTTNAQPRRVIHIEFSNAALPGGLEWAEKEALNC
jgi:hypothetical protein